jgi:hypothetical protein
VIANVAVLSRAFSRSNVTPRGLPFMASGGSSTQLNCRLCARARLASSRQPFASQFVVPVIVSKVSPPWAASSSNESVLSPRWSGEATLSK